VTSERILELQCEAAELRDQVSFYDSRCQELQRQLEVAQNRLQASESDVTRLERTLEDTLVPGTDRSLEEDMRILTTSLEATRAALSREQVRVDELTGLLQHSEQRYDEIVNELDEAYDALEEAHHKELENVQTDLDRLRDLEQTMQERLQEKDRAIDDLMDGLHKANAKFDAQLEKLQKENTELKARIAEISEEAASKLPEEMREALEKEQAEHRKQRQSLEQELRDVRRDLELKDQDIERLQTTSESRQKRAGELEAELKKIREQFTSKEDELGVVRTALREAQEKVEDAPGSEEMTAIKAEMAEMERELERLRKRPAEEASSQLQILQGRLSALEQDNEMLRVTLKTVRTARTQAEEEREQFRIRAEEFRRRLLKLEEAGKQEPQVDTARIAELEAEKLELETRAIEAEKSLAAQQDAAKQVRAKNETKVKELEEKIQSLQGFVHKETAKAAKGLEAQERLDSVEEERKEQVDRIQTLKTELKQSQEDLETARQQLAGQESAARTLATRDKQLAKAKRELKAAQEELEEAKGSQSEITSRDEQIQELEEKISGLLREREAFEDEVETRLTKQRKTFEQKIEDVRKAAVEEVESDKIKALKVQIDFLKNKERQLDKMAAQEKDLQRRLHETVDKIRDSEERNAALEKSVEGMETLVLKQKEGYEKQIASMQAELDSARQSAAAIEAEPAKADVLKNRIEELLQERGSLQAKVKTHNDAFVEFKNRLEKIQKLVKLKDDRISFLERKLEDARAEGRKSARKTMRRIKTKLGLKSEGAASDAAEKHEEKLREIRDKVAHQRDTFEERIQKIKESALTDPKADWPESPKGKDVLKEEAKQIASRKGHHTAIQGYELSITRGGIFGRKDIADKLYGVSEGGLRVGILDRLGEGEKVRIRLRVKQFGDTIDAEGKVNWCREMVFKKRWDADISFVNIKGEDVRKIRRWLGFFASFGKPPGERR
jgi:chromosome segregation ATPase